MKRTRSIWNRAATTRLLFALIMGALMVGSLTLLRVLALTEKQCSLGQLFAEFIAQFFSTYLIAVPLIFILAPIANKLVSAIAPR